MKLVQVVDGEITQYSLPRVGTLKDGRTVSGYHLLDEDILREEGWLPLEDNPPSYDEDIQYLVHDGYEILNDRVVKKYRIEDIEEEIPPEPSEMDILNERVNTQDAVIEEILFDIIPNLLEVQGGE